VVEVSLLKLVQVIGSQDAWPDDFRAMNEHCQADPTDRTPFGVAADWLDEHGEPELADAFRWLHRRPTVVVRWVEPNRNSGQGYYTMEKPPVTMTCADGVTVAALCARLVPILKQMREALA